MPGMYWIFVMVGDTLNHAIYDEAELTKALLVQLHKAMLQMAIDGGSWETARYLWPEVDVFDQAEWGGDELEMRSVHQYKRAIAELRAKPKNFEQGGQQDADDAAGSGAAPKAKPKKKGGGRGSNAAGTGE